MKLRVFGWLLIFFIKRSNGLHAIISSKSNNTVFDYKDNNEGELGLHMCDYYEACNAVHKRFWRPVLTERLCQCPNGLECSWQWNENFDNVSMMLDNRSVLKFCTDITHYEICTRNQTAARVYGKNDTKNNNYIIPLSVNVYCKCPSTHYWKLRKYTYGDGTITQIFKCVQKKICKGLDFCGYIRVDHYSTYYRCTCPINHLCIFKDREEDNVQELLYSGPAYKAYCIAN